MENLDDRAIEQVAAFFSAFAVPMRLKILNALRYGERNVGDLAAALGSGQANMSKHLRLLAEAGLIEKSTRGTSAFYRIADPRIYHLCDLVCAQVGRRLEKQAEAREAFAGAGRAARPAARKRAAHR
jgi:DNA-binding transcriptional ArsR family regulator